MEQLPTLRASAIVRLGRPVVNGHPRTSRGSAIARGPVRRSAATTVRNWLLQLDDHDMKFAHAHVLRHVLGRFKELRFAVR